MDLPQIRELLKIVAESGVAEVEIEENDFKLVVRLNTPNVSIQAPQAFPALPPQPPPYPVYPAYPHAPVAPPMPLAEMAPPPAAAPVPQAAAPAPSAPPADAAPVQPAANEHVIKAPIVGTFYEAPSPDSDPFVKVGDKVQPGDVLCIIEAMKLMNEIECEVGGTISQILIENSEPVEYDQPLFVITKS